MVSMRIQCRYVYFLVGLPSGAVSGHRYVASWLLENW
jgi:hypothetical protein